MPHTIDLVASLELVITRLWGNLDSRELRNYADTMESKGPFPEPTQLLVLIDASTEIKLDSNVVRDMANRATMFGADAARVVVAPTALSFGLARMFGLHAPVASDQYRIVTDIVEASNILGLDHGLIVSEIGRLRIYGSQ